MKIKKSRNHDDRKFRESFLIIVSGTFGAVLVRHVEPLFVTGFNSQTLINFIFAYALIFIAIYFLFF